MPSPFPGARAQLISIPFAFPGKRLGNCSLHRLSVAGFVPARWVWSCKSQIHSVRRVKAELPKAGLQQNGPGVLVLSRQVSAGERFHQVRDPGMAPGAVGPWPSSSAGLHT